MKRILVITAATLALAGCGGVPEDESATNPAVTSGTLEDGSEVSVIEVEVNGKPVSCVVYNSYREGGISCDFRVRAD